MTKSSLVLTGIGLRAEHYQDILEQRPALAWLEIHSENYFAQGSKANQQLDKIRQYYPISMHGIGLSIGSADELNWSHLQKLRELCQRIHPCLLSDHLSWSSINGQYFHDLLPLPYTEESLIHVAERILQIQDYLKRQILIENISSYVQYKHSTLSEWEFIQEIARRTGCGILLDVNNIYVSAMNLGFDPLAYINALDSQLIQELHLAGFSKTKRVERDILVDTHNQPVANQVWELYRSTITRIGRKPTIIEWDSDLPSLEQLCQEAYRAEAIMRETYEFAKSAS